MAKAATINTPAGDTVTVEEIVNGTPEQETPEAISGTVVEKVDPEKVQRLNEQQSIIFADISSYVLRTQEVQQRVGRALNVIRANDLWKVARDVDGDGFKSFSAYLNWLGEQTGYARTNYLRMQKEDVTAYIESGEAPEGFEAPTSRGGASGVKYATFADAADVTLRQLDGFFERWAERAAKVRGEDEEGNKVEDTALNDILNMAILAMQPIRDALSDASATE